MESSQQENTLNNIDVNLRLLIRNLSGLRMNIFIVLSDSETFQHANVSTEYLVTTLDKSEEKYLAVQRGHRFIARPAFQHVHANAGWRYSWTVEIVHQLVAKFVQTPSLNFERTISKFPFALF